MVGNLKYNNRRLRHFDKDASDFIERAGLNSESNMNVDGLYTAQQARMAVDSIVKGMKSIGVWDKMKAVYLMLGGTSTMTALNLMGTDFTITWYGGVNFMPDGVKGNGADGYGDTGLNPKNNISPTSTHLSVFTLNTDSINPDEFEIGAGDTSSGTGTNTKYLAMNTRRQNDMCGFGSSNINNNEYVLAGNISKGCMIGTLLDDNTSRIFINGVKIPVIKAGVYGNDLPDSNIYIFRCSNLGQNSIKKISFATIGDGLTDTQATQLSNLITNFNRSLNRTEQQGVLARFNFSPAGAETSTGWVNLGGDPNKGIIQATSDGVTVENTSLWNSVNGASAYTNTNTLGGIRYLDDSGVEQLLPQALTRSNWINGSNTRSIILKNVPSGNYKLRIWSYVSATGSWNSTTATVTFVAHGLTDVTATDYKYYLNTDDRVKGVILDVKPKVDGTITVDVNWGTGAYFGAIICALELRQYF